MRKCTKCNETKDISAFYNDRSRKDGLTTACKNCRRLYLLQYRKTSTSWKEQHRITVQRYKKRNRERVYARRKLRYEIQIGRVIPPYICEVIKTTYHEGRLEAHHYLGYAGEHWKDVRWLCQRHHNIEHGRLA